MNNGFTDKYVLMLKMEYINNIGLVLYVHEGIVFGLRITVCSSLYVEIVKCLPNNSRHHKKVQDSIFDLATQNTYL